MLDQILLNNAKSFPEKSAFIFHSKDIISDSICYSDFVTKVQNLAGYLQSFGKKRIVLVLLPTGLDSIIAFYACLFSGWIYVPLQSPDDFKQKKGAIYLNYINQILSDFDDPLIMSDSLGCDFLMNKGYGLLSVNNIKLVNTDIITDNYNYSFRKSSPDDIVTLLYTSGSTSSPKGVIVKHKNLLYNAQTAKEYWNYEKNSVSVSWTPHFHSLGLIFNFIVPVFTGTTCVILSSYDFIENPMRWLSAISNHKASHSVSPAFGYDHCCSQIDLSTLLFFDLSSWKVALSGGEPIRRKTFEDFFNKFSVYGFKQETFCPQYGLSETGHVTSKRVTLAPEFINYNSLDDEYAIASVGEPFHETIIKVLNPENSELCNEGKIGEVCIAGPSLFDSYWRRDDVNAESFIYLPSNSNEQLRYFKTGDLGFLKNGELVITGRLKEIMIIRGKNYFPNDIELLTSNSNKLFENEKSAVFSVLVEGLEEVVIVQEVNPVNTESFSKDDFCQIYWSILESLEEIFFIDINSIHLVPRNSIPRTQSGKISRSLSKELFINDGIVVIDSFLKDNLDKQHSCSNTMNVSNTGNDCCASISDNILEDNVHGQILKDIFSEILSIPIDELIGNRSFSYLNINSMQALLISKEIEARFNIPFSVTQMFKYNNLNSLNQHVTLWLQS